MKLFNNYRLNLVYILLFSFTLLHSQTVLAQYPPLVSKALAEFSTRIFPALAEPKAKILTIFDGAIEKKTAADLFAILAQGSWTPAGESISRITDGEFTLSYDQLTRVGKFLGFDAAPPTLDDLFAYPQTLKRMATRLDDVIHTVSTVNHGYGGVSSKDVALISFYRQFATLTVAFLKRSEATELNDQVQRFRMVCLAIDALLEISSPLDIARSHESTEYLLIFKTRIREAFNRPGKDPSGLFDIFKQTADVTRYALVYTWNGIDSRFLKSYLFGDLNRAYNNLEVILKTHGLMAEETPPRQLVETIDLLSDPKAVNSASNFINHLILDIR
jgi:hypothetical protein